MRFSTLELELDFKFKIKLTPDEGFSPTIIRENVWHATVVKLQ